MQVIDEKKQLQTKITDSHPSCQHKASPPRVSAKLT